MSKLQIESTLNGMKGKVYMHGTINKTILRFNVDDQNVRVITDVDDIIIPIDQFKLQLQDFLPVDDTHLPAVANKAVQTTVIGSSAMELKNILMDNIRKVQSDKEYIPQAEAVNANVKSIIDLAKAEIDLVKAMRG